jgi:isochorismate synthase
VAAPQLDPLAFWANGQRLGGERFYWEQPGSRSAVVGIGSAHTFVFPNAGKSDSSVRRFEEAAIAWRTLLEGALIEGDAQPLLLGGFSFDPLGCRTPAWRGFPPGRLALPSFTLMVDGDASRLTVNAVLRAADEAEMVAKQEAAALRTLGEEPPEHIERWPSSNGPSPRTLVDLRPAESWRALVAEARSAIRAGRLEKIVLARAVRTRAGAQRGGLVPVLARLRRAYPECTIFAASQEGRSFLGATPERLVRLRDGLVSVDAVAGTTGRGRTEEEDRLLGAGLLDSAKERAEHEVVLRTLQDQLAPSCADLSVPADPLLLKLRNVQHLHTPLSGRLVSGECILNLVERLHPSPAVGGFPRETALAFIRAREELDRGWYAGPIGWMDRHGEGEFAVAIRSALLDEREALLYAGCGIMGDSVPEREYEESCLKLKSMLSVLDGA